MTGWGIVYPIQSQTNATSRVFIRNFVSYAHLTDGKWVSVQDQAIMPMGGAHFAAAFSGKQLPLSSNQKRPDGAWEIESPPAGYNDHFWPDERGHFDPGTVDGVFVQFDIRTDNPAAHLVAAPGADYWRDATAQSIGSTDTATNRGLGTANFTRLSTQWQTLYYYSLSTDQIEADLPPPLAGAAVPISDKRR